MLFGGVVHLVFHFEHYRHNFHAVLIALAVNIVALAVFFYVVILFKIGVFEGGGAQAVKLVFAVLFKGFAHHFGRKAQLHIAQSFNAFILFFKALFVLLLNIFNFKLVFLFGVFLFGRKLKRLFLFLAKKFGLLGL